MKISKFASDLLAGRIRHWRKKNTTMINEFWSAIQNLDEPIKTIYEHLFVATSAVVEELAAPGGKAADWASSLEIDAKKTSLDKFRQLYSVLFGFLVLQFGSLNVRLESILKENLTAIVKEKELITRVLIAYENYFQGISNNKKEPLDLADFSLVVWNEIVEIMGSASKEHGLEFIPLSIFWGHVSISAFKRINQELSNKVDN